MPKTNMVSAFRWIGTWRRWWLFLHCCQGCISVKLFLSLVSGIISLIPLHAGCDILLDSWESSGTTWALPRCAGWVTSSHHSWKSLKGARALLEVHSDKDTGEVLTKFGVKHMGFIPGCESELSPMCFHLHRFHFCSQGIYPVRDLREEKADTAIFSPSYSHCSFFRVLLGSQKPRLEMLIWAPAPCNLREKCRYSE